jgi:hypothetical protein
VEIQTGPLPKFEQTFTILTACSTKALTPVRKRIKDGIVDLVFEQQFK